MEVRDQLSREERIRLECLNQANAENLRVGGWEDESQVLKRAKQFEGYVVNGKITDDFDETRETVRRGLLGDNREGTTNPLAD